jgi:hypothetical protein
MLLKALSGQEALAIFTNQRKFYSSIDLHARKTCLYLLDKIAKSILQQNVNVTDGAAEGV